MKRARFSILSKLRIKERKIPAKIRKADNRIVKNSSHTHSHFYHSVIQDVFLAKENP